MHSKPHSTYFDRNCQYSKQGESKSEEQATIGEYPEEERRKSEDDSGVNRVAARERAELSADGRVWRSRPIHQDLQVRSTIRAAVTSAPRVRAETRHRRHMTTAATNPKEMMRLGEPARRTVRTGGLPEDLVVME